MTRSLSSLADQRGQSAKQRAAHILDRIVSSVTWLKEERHSLICLVFHSIFNDNREIAADTILPQEMVTIGYFRECLQYFSSHEYAFVSPEDVKRGLSDSANYILITFDDGYFNNTRILPILEEYSAPAVFSICTTNVKEGNCFWWDVVYRQRRQEGRPYKEISRELAALERQSIEQRDRYVLNLSREKALRPRGDIDRPFTPDELKRFAKEKYVLLGNHTRDHAFLPACSPDEMRYQLSGCQQDIMEMTHKLPVTASYPHGKCTPQVIEASRKAGLRVGVTGERRKNCFPIKDPMCLGRFSLCGTQPVTQQCRIIRSDLTMSRMMDMYRRITSRQAA